MNNKRGLLLALFLTTQLTGHADATVLTKGSGDALIVPYYTFQDSFSTGIHITNTSSSTQIVKVRFHRGSNGIQVFDFNIVLSPYDVWTGSIGNQRGIPTMVTGDTSCTVPAFPPNGVSLPQSYSVVASEGYIEVIGMAQTMSEEEPIAISAKHINGVPKDCDDVRQNFYRVSNEEFDEGVESRGVHHSELTSNGEEFSHYTDTGDASLTGSFMVTNPVTGEEFGGRTPTISGLASKAMMTNQSRPVYTATGQLRYDPYNLNLPNFVQGSYLHSRSADRLSNHNGSSGHSSDDIAGSLFIDFRKALGVDEVISEWATRYSDLASVTATLVLTMPAQYAMRNDLCVLWSELGNCNTLFDFDERPLLLYSGSSNSKQYFLKFYDREESPIDTFELGEVEDDLVFSGLPDSGGIEVEEELLPGTLPWAVNVLNWVPSESSLEAVVKNPLNSRLQTQIRFFGEASAGVNYLDIRPATSGNAYFVIGDPTFAAGQALSQASSVGNFVQFPSDSGDTALLGGNVWLRKFSSQAGDYGRWIPISYR